MSDHVHHMGVPRGALLAALGLVLCTLVAVASVRLGYVPAAADPQVKRSVARATVVRSRDLSFIDAADGAVAIRDAATGNVTTAVVAGTKTGFIRGVMRGLARDRHLHAIGRDAPFRLTSWSNGDLTLTDPQTGRTIELGAFGATNRAAFAALL